MFSLFRSPSHYRPRWEIFFKNDISSLLLRTALRTSETYRNNIMEIVEHTRKNELLVDMAFSPFEDIQICLHLNNLCSAEFVTVTQQKFSCMFFPKRQKSWGFSVAVELHVHGKTGMFVWQNLISSHFFKSRTKGCTTRKWRFLENLPKWTFVVCL